MTDPVNHPPHYTQHPSGVECITIVEHMNFCRGNAIKYIWRAGDKGNEIEDLKKARWYLDREIARLEGQVRADAERATEETITPLMVQATLSAFALARAPAPSGEGVARPEPAGD